MTLGPLPAIEHREYEVGDVVVYDGFVFQVTSPTQDGTITLGNHCGDVERVPENFISLL